MRTIQIWIIFAEFCGLRISMSCAGNPYDNAKAERFTRSLKEEAESRPPLRQKVGEASAAALQVGAKRANPLSLPVKCARALDHGL